MATCTTCGVYHPDTYVGINEVECMNSACMHYHMTFDWRTEALQFINTVIATSPIGTIYPGYYTTDDAALAKFNSVDAAPVVVLSADTFQKAIDKLESCNAHVNEPDILNYGWINSWVGLKKVVQYCIENNIEG